MAAAERFPVSPRLVLGLAAIALGVLLTLDNLQLRWAEGILELWPLVLIALGAVKLASPGSGRLVGLLLAGVGLWLLLDNLEILPYDLFDYWPLFLVLAGIGLILTSFRAGAGSAAEAARARPTASGFALLSANHLTSSSQAFRGGDLVAVAGGCTLDLRGAATDGTAVVDTFAFWGGVEIHVPETWTVESRVVPVMGGFGDSTRAPLVDTGSHLLVKGIALMGGVEVNNGPKDG